MSHMPWWLAPSGPGHPGPVEHERDAAAVQGDVHQQLVEGAVQEGRVDGHHRVQPGHRQPAAEVTACCSAMPTSNTRSGKAAANRLRPVGWIIAARDGDDPLVHRPELDHLLGEDVGPVTAPGPPIATPVLASILPTAWKRSSSWFSAGGVAVALAGQAVHQDGSAELLGLPQRSLDRRHVVTVDRTDVLQPEIGEHALRRDHVLQPDLDPVQQVVGGAPEQRCPVDLLADELEDLLVPRVGAQTGEVPRQPADRRGVGAAVVVDQDHQRQVVVGRDVVERLPGHATGQRTVADQRHHGAGPCLAAAACGDARPRTTATVDACEFSTQSCSDSARLG